MPYASTTTTIPFETAHTYIGDIYIYIYGSTPPSPLGGGGGGVFENRGQSLYATMAKKLCLIYTKRVTLSQVYRMGQGYTV